MNSSTINTLNPTYLLEMAHKELKDPTKESSQPAETFKTLNRRQAEGVSWILSAIGYEIKVPGKGNPDNSELEKDIEKNIECLAGLEHERWNNVRWIQGGKYGPIRNDAEKIHPF